METVSIVSYIIWLYVAYLSVDMKTHSFHRFWWWLPHRQSLAGLAPEGLLWTGQSSTLGVAQFQCPDVLRGFGKLHRFHSLSDVRTLVPAWVSSASLLQIWWFFFSKDDFTESFTKNSWGARAEFVDDYTDFYPDRSDGWENHGDGFVKGAAECECQSKIASMTC